MNITHAPKEVRVAFEHVRSLFPEVIRLEFDNQCRWSYSYADGCVPNFDGKVDQSLLEAAADAQYNVAVPAVYYDSHFIGVVSLQDRFTLVLSRHDENDYTLQVDGENTIAEFTDVNTAFQAFLDKIDELNKKA